MNATLTRRLKALEATQPKPDALKPKAIILAVAGVPDEEQTCAGAIVVGKGNLQQRDGESFAAFRERVRSAVR